MSTNHIYVAFLRGINVGGKGIVSMTNLKAVFEKLGYDNVRTYINSGNVIFSAGESDARKLETHIEKALDAELKMTIKVVVRSKQEIENLLENLPKSWAHPEDKRCYVMFLRHTVDKPEVLDGIVIKEEIEELHYVPGALLWSALLTDVTRSNMSKLISNPVYKELTIRNLNTVMKVVGMMKERLGAI